MLARPDVTDIYVNRPGELWVETIGGEIERHDAPGARRSDPGPAARQIAALVPSGDQPRASFAVRDPARRRAGAGGGAAGDARPAGARDPQARLARSGARRLCRRRRLRRDARRATALRALGRRPGAGGAARRGRHRRHARRGGQGAQEHPRLGRHLDRQDHLPERPAARDPGRGAADPDRGHARAAGAPRQCGRPARGAQRARRGAGQRQRPASPRRSGCGRTGSSSASCAARRPMPSCARSIPAIRAR